MSLFDESPSQATTRCKTRRSNAGSLAKLATPGLPPPRYEDIRELVQSVMPEYDKDTSDGLDCEEFAAAFNALIAGLAPIHAQLRRQMIKYTVVFELLIYSGQGGYHSIWICTARQKRFS